MIECTVSFIRMMNIDRNMPAYTIKYTLGIFLELNL